MNKGPWYNTTIYTRLNGQNFEDYLKIWRKYRYELMCYVDTNYKDHVWMLDDSISGGERKMTSMSYKEAILAIVHRINFIDIWLQWFEVGYQNIIIILEKMCELFKKISKSLPPENLMITEKMFRQLSRQYVGNSKLPPIKRVTLKKRSKLN